MKSIKRTMLTSKSALSSSQSTHQFVKSENISAPCLRWHRLPTATFSPDAVQRQGAIQKFLLVFHLNVMTTLYVTNMFLFFWTSKSYQSCCDSYRNQVGSWWPLPCSQTILWPRRGYVHGKKRVNRLGHSSRRRPGVEAVDIKAMIDFPPLFLYFLLLILLNG